MKYVILVSILVSGLSSAQISFNGNSREIPSRTELQQQIHQLEKKVNLLVEQLNKSEKPQPQQKKTQPGNSSSEQPSLTVVEL